MFKNIKIETKQKWGNKCIDFDPDSSPKAWEHYKEYYKITNYDIRHPKLLNYKIDKDGYNLIEKPTNQNVNRLFALKYKTETKKNKAMINCYKADCRLAGECDFNFNDKKLELFKELIGNNQQALIQLNRCKQMHHSLLNFSLMQVVGNMQGVKGSNKFDRPDVLINKINKYKVELTEDILLKSTCKTKKYLISYLNGFKDIYDYCKTIYFIDDRAFIDKMIDEGKLEIDSCESVIRYMNLAEEFWALKEFYFMKREFLCIGDYFNEGGENYSEEELLGKIENDLGLDKVDGKKLIDICIKRGFILDCGNSYTH